MAMASKGMHRKARVRDVELAIAVASAVPLSAIISLTLGCYIGLSGTGVLAATLLLTAMFTAYAVTVRALCRERATRTSD